MAFEEITGADPVPAAAAPVVGKSLPPYPEMIMAAIESLKDPNGSSKSAIARQIDATYGELPPAHSTLLAHHLSRMKGAGLLTLSKNNYFKPDPNAPPRRGRGRPPKPKPALPEGYVPGPSRPRGRPPKLRDPLAPPPPPPKRKDVPSEGSGRKRGRPPKLPRASPEAALTPATVTPAAAGTSDGAPRGRGRPPKVKPAVPAAAPAATVGA